MVSNPGLFSFSQTEPSDLYPGSYWATTEEGPQNCRSYSDHGSAHSGEAEDYMCISGQTTPRGTRLDRIHTQARQDIQANWTASRTAPAMPHGGQAMSRVSSSRSNGSSLSQMSSLSNMDITGNASYRNGPYSASTTTGGMESCLLLDNEVLAHQMYWPQYPVNMSLNVDTTLSLPQHNTLHVDPAQMQFGPDVPVMDNNSPVVPWDCISSSISRSSSPATIEEMWLSSQSPNSSPEILCQSPSHDNKISVMPEDLSGEVVPKLEEPLTLPPPFGTRRLSTEGETARNHQLYKEAAIGPDGLYHCPWEGKSTCNHKPEKLKCNYDKFVDSHLKPYRCKIEACQEARFSSTACLLRHEREAHGLHGHGDKPFLCIYEGCERAVPGNGFPRQWNLRDHMKRVHNDHGSASASPVSGPTSTQAPKNRKRKPDVPETPAPASRKASVKSMPAEPKQPSTRPLLDQWMDNRKIVENLVRGLGKPEDTDNITRIHDMQKRLETMLKLTDDIRAINAIKIEMMPSAGLNGFVGTG